MIRKLDFIGIPTQDPVRARSFYVETLGLQADENAHFCTWTT